MTTPAVERYACPPIDSLWTLQAQYGRWTHVWQIALQVQLGHYVVNMPNPLGGPAGWPWFEAEVEAAERVTGHDVAAVLQVTRSWLQERGDTEAAHWLHYGLCSSDVVDAGWLLAMSDVTEKLRELGVEAAQALGDLGETLGDEKAVFRTHGRPAEVAAHWRRWEGHRVRLLSAISQMNRNWPSKIGFNGPTGTGATADFDGGALGQALGLHIHGSGAQAADRVEWSRWLSNVADLATVCQRIALEVRLLTVTGEAFEGRSAGYVGSSSMPHKSSNGTNPTRSERICGLAAMVRGLANGYAEAAGSVWGSHSLEHSSAERLAIPQVTSLTGFILTETAEVVRTLFVDREAVEDYARAATDAGAVGSYERHSAEVRSSAPPRPAGSS